MTKKSRLTSTSRWITATIAAAAIAAVVVAGWMWFRPTTAQEALRRGHYQLAIQYLRKAADKGDIGAQNQIGNLYALGLGMPRDRQVAANWYRKAAFAGSADARVNMGHLFDHAFTLDGGDQQIDIHDPNAKLAYAWFNLARNQGHSQAQLYMSDMLHAHRVRAQTVRNIRHDYATIENFRDVDNPNISP